MAKKRKAPATLLLTRRIGGGNWCLHAPDCEHADAIAAASELEVQQADADALNRLRADHVFVDKAPCVPEE